VKVFLSVAFILFATTVHADMVIDVKKIAGKTADEVAIILGAPESCEVTKYGRSCLYRKGETEIVFINGKADWITIEGIDHIPFSTSALTAIGLEETSPSFRNDFTMRWHSIQGLMEVSIFKGSSNSDYAYIRTITI
jgi:hypothetical protein